MPDLRLSFEEEARLIRQAQHHPESFGILYELNYDRVYAFLYRKCSNTTVAEDLTSETFFRAFNNINKYQIRDTFFLAWLFRIAYMTWVSHWRKEKIRRIFRLDRRRNGQLESFGETSPIGQAEINNAGEMLKRFMQRLKPRDQLILSLHYYEDLSFNEIAWIAGVTPTFVRQRHRRILMKLKTMIENEAPDLAALIQGDNYVRND